LELFRLYGSVLVDNKDSIKKLKESDKRAREASKTFKNMGKAVKTMGKVALAGTAAAGAALIGMATKASQTADAIHKGSQRMGISTKAYQELEYWASQNGLAQQQLEKGVGRLNQRMGAAAEGNKKYSGALKKLGINMDDVKNGTISTEDAFSKAVQTLSGMKNEQEKAALATEMFGTKLARDMLPALNDGSLSLEDAKKKAAELGIVIGDKAINDGVKFTDTMDSMKRSLGGIATKVGLAVLPKVQQFLDWITTNMPLIKEKIRDAMDKGREVVDKLKDSFEFLKEKANILVPVLSGLLAGIVAFKVITTIIESIKKMKALMLLWKTSTFAQTLAQHGLNAALMANPVGLVVAAITALIAIGVALYMNWDVVKEKAQLLWNKMKSVGAGIKNAFVDMKNAVVKKITELSISAKNKFNEIRNTMKTKIIDAVTTVKNKVIEMKNNFVSKVVEIATSIRNKFIQIKNSIVNPIQNAVSGGINKFNSLKSNITSRVSQIYNTIRDKFNAAKSAITNPIETAKNGVRRAIDKIKGFFNFKWKLPSIKLPHFSISGNPNPIKWLKEGVPKVKVKWYKKGGFMDSATPFNMLGNTISVGGEAGNEGIVPLEGRHMMPFADAVAERLNNIKNKGINLTQHIYSPDPLTPSEVGRKSRNYLKNLVLEMA